MELEPNEHSPLAAFVRFALETGLYLSGDASQARKPLEEALDLAMAADLSVLRIVVESWLSMVTTEEGRPEEAELRARAARTLVDRLRARNRAPNHTCAHRARSRARRPGKVR